MNFSKFSQNKLDKEQMMAVKGGSQTCKTYPGSKWFPPVTVCDNIENGKCWRSTGISYFDTQEGDWGWFELGGQPC